MLINHFGLTEIKKDILCVEKGIIVQQVNCQKTMGAGLAKAIANKYPRVEVEYKKHDLILGMVLPIKISPTLWVANLASQNEYGTDKRHTDFFALEKCLIKLQSRVKEKHSIYIPYGLGSGLAGGSTEKERDHTWLKVQEIIARTIPKALICKLPS